jgi:hypothetical protein
MLVMVCGNANCSQVLATLRKVKNLSRGGENRMSRFKSLLPFLLLLLVGVVTTNSAWGDELYGRVRGTVTDQSGAVLAGAEVRLTNIGTGATLVQSSTNDGSFVFANLVSGTYKLSASKSGFKLFEVSGINIIQNQIYVQQVRLEVGTVSEAVEVSAQNTQVETTSIQLGATLSGSEIRDLPSLNRNWINLQQTLPGVVTADTRFGTKLSSERKRLERSGSQLAINAAQPGHDRRSSDGHEHHQPGIRSQLWRHHECDDEAWGESVPWQRV